LNLHSMLIKILDRQPKYPLRHTNVHWTLVQYGLTRKHESAKRYL